jgi:6-phosphogluconolactonase (cycloisomerase 2 family)
MLVGVAAPLGPAWALGELFVANSLASSITVYARTASGSVAPVRTIAGPVTGLNGPFGIAVDPVHEELVVANNNDDSITVYRLTASGDVAPLRTIAGPATGLHGPVGVALDLLHDEMLVANVQVPASITVYSRTANGNVAPLRTITGAATNLVSPLGVLVDTVHDELAVTDDSDHINVFGRTSNGNVAPLRTIIGALTQLASPRSIALDSAADLLVVGNGANDSVTAYARTADGNVAPVRMLVGPATGLASPRGVVVDGEELLVANQTRVSVYSREATGNTNPLRLFGGVASGLNMPTFMALVPPRVLISTGTGPGGGPHVNLFRFDAANSVPTQLGGGFFAYDPGFTGGVQATLVGVQGDYYLVIGVGSSGGPHIKIFRVTDFATGAVTALGGGFMAYDPGFTGGARVAASADAAGNLFIVTGAGPGGGAHVKVFLVTDLTTGAVIQLGDGFFAYDPGFLGGVNVGAW